MLDPWKHPVSVLGALALFPFLSSLFLIVSGKGDLADVLIFTMFDASHPGAIFVSYFFTISVSHFFFQTFLHSQHCVCSASVKWTLSNDIMGD